MEHCQENPCQCEGLRPRVDHQIRYTRKTLWESSFVQASPVFRNRRIHWYLFHQCGKTFNKQHWWEKIDQFGIIDEKDYAAEENEEEEEENATVEESNNESIDSLVFPGWNEDDRLAKALIDQEGISLSIEASNVIIWFHKQLDHCDKRPIKYEKIKMKPAICPQRR